MELKNKIYKIKGMNMDLSNSIFNPEFSWKNKNIRLSIRGSNDVLKVTNEKGNLKLLINGTLEDSYSPSLSQWSNVVEIVSYRYNILNTNYEKTLIVKPIYSYLPTLYNYRNTLINT